MIHYLDSKRRVKEKYSRKEERATSDMIVNEALVCLFSSKVFEWIGPKKITHESMSWRFTETVDLRRFEEKKRKERIEKVRGNRFENFRSSHTTGSSSQRFLIIRIWEETTALIF